MTMAHSPENLPRRSLKSVPRPGIAHADGPRPAVSDARAGEFDRALPALVINLARSAERWERVAASVVRSGLKLQRIDAVEGAAIPNEERGDFDAARFRQNHGRTVLDGEYGCYRSHMRALGMVVEGNYPIAIISEDDVGFSAGMNERVAAIFATKPDIDLLKLVNHRVSGFVFHGTSALGDDFGRCVHGPQGSAACYAVSQRGAAILLESLATMWLPYDIAFERGWATGANTFTTRLPLVIFDALQADTTIATRNQYLATKLPKIRQIKTAMFRGLDYSARAAYALKGR